MNLDAARARFGDRVDRLVPYFYQTDELADRAVASMGTLPHGQGWKLFQRGLRLGIDRLDDRDVPEPLRALLAEIERVPAWVDRDVLERGAAVFRRSGLLGGIVLGAKSLVHGYASPAGNKPLIFSGRLREQATRRLNETARFVQAVTQRGGLQRDADGFQISVKVRLMHAQVRRMILASGRWPPEHWGAPINQHDLSATSLLFSQSVLMGLRTLGVRITINEGDSYVHLWRYVGWLMGGDPELLPASEVEALRLAELIGMTMGAPDDDSKALTRALMESPVFEAKLVSTRRWAERRAAFGYAMARELVGNVIADGLELPITRWRFAIPPIKTVVSAMELVREHSPLANRAALDFGTKYWQRVVDLGLDGASADFGLPQRLAHG